MVRRHHGARQHSGAVSAAAVRRDLRQARRQARPPHAVYRPWHDRCGHRVHQPVARRRCAAEKHRRGRRHRRSRRAARRVPAGGRPHAQDPRRRDVRARGHLHGGRVCRHHEPGHDRRGQDRDEPRLHELCRARAPGLRPPDDRAAPRRAHRLYRAAARRARGHGHVPLPRRRAHARCYHQTAAQ